MSSPTPIKPPKTYKNKTSNFVCYGALFLGFVTMFVCLILSSISWSNWDSFRQNKQPNENVNFMWYIALLSISSLILLSRPTLLIFQALGTASMVQYVFGVINILLIYVASRVFTYWDEYKTRESYSEIWELSWVGTCAPAAIIVGIILLLYYTRGKLCSKM